MAEKPRCNSMAWLFKTVVCGIKDSFGRLIVEAVRQGPDLCDVDLCEGRAR